MSTEKCKQLNPLTRSGTNQPERYLDALDPNSIDVDERSLADLVQFAQRFSEHIKYRDSDNAEDGNWEPFFSSDITAILAGLSKLPLESFLDFYRGLMQFLSDDPSRPVADLSSHFKLLFHLPLLLLREAGEYFDRLPKDHPLRPFMSKVVRRDVETPLKDLISYYKGVLVLDEPPINDAEIFADTALDPTDYNVNFSDADPRIQLPTVVTERIAGSTRASALAISADLVVKIAPTGWSDLFTATAADPSPYVDSLGSPYDQIFDTLNFNLVTKAFDRLFQAADRIAREASKYFAETLTALDSHTPHYGLWLAFLQLFERNQDHINTLTERHLDYYYKEVLQLCLQKARPDQVHLLFELSKNVEEHKLDAASTLFKAGKDADGNPVVYKLDSDFVINRASVGSLKSVNRPSFKMGGFEFFAPWSSAVTNSKDGEGEELPKGDPQWKSFGPIAGLPDARIGFALADPQLFLREGNRAIAVAVHPEIAVPPMFLPPAFKAWLTAEDGWFEITGPPKMIAGSIGSDIWFLLGLDGEDPAIVPYDEEIHGEGYSTNDPVLKIEFDFQQDPAWSVIMFSLMKDLRFDSVKLVVAVSDARNFTLQGDAGLLDTSKPFLPFGPTPVAGSSLLLGSSELFSKKLNSITLNLTWEQALNTTGFVLKDAADSFEVSTRHLQKGKWLSLGSAKDLFVSGAKAKSIQLTGLSALSASVEQTLENAPYSPESRAGFVRLDLNKGFGHDKYQAENTLALIAKAGGTARTSTTYNYENDLPKAPYTPKISEISLSYLTVLEAPASFFHLHPFGHTAESSTSERLFPETANEGELFIGIRNLDPPQRLSMLFQTVDGSANPLKPENTVKWHYLKGDEWVELEQQEVDDKTNNLTGSGIVGIAVPEAADTLHSILPTGVHWFRMSVESDADALNNLLSIDAQAATATFLDQGNDPDFVATPLAGGTISKLVASNAAVKKITQPYDSFGGRPQEEDEAFYVRASERLRHKDRAVTMWDFEHLVLQEFPSIYKVKCLNHTQLVRDAVNEIVADNELKPGHVVVVPIRYVSPDGAVNPLRPYTDKKTLGQIDRFL
ncbi:MAG TPA: hypothetical protein VMO47_16820, partial [Rhodothermales bacterium]|nr:hypothetical protein [Rhodothermales bacterium]